MIWSLDEQAVTKVDLLALANRRKGETSMRTVIGSAMVIAVALGVSVGVQGATPAQGDAAKIAAGKTAYTTLKCGTCHMIEKVGGKTASALDGIGAKMKEEDIRKWLTATAEMEAKLAKKSTMMTTWMKSKKLSDADVAGITAYLFSLKK
jgi:mono/diheme cytochrome c family protein